MTFIPRSDLSSGARNLYLNCAECQAGEQILLIHEPSELGYFDALVSEHFMRIGRELGLHVDTVPVGFYPDRPALSEELKTRMRAYDVVVFLARLGDQLRFVEMPHGPRSVVCFAPDGALLGSGFGCADYRAFVELKQAVDDLFWSAQKIEVTCPNGTHFQGQIAQDADGPRDTNVRRFPMSIFSPVPATLFSGQVALGGFLTGTGSKYYEDYTVEFTGQVFAHLNDGRLTGFSGSAADVALANAQYDRVATLFGLERNFVHSWHAGIHPGCGYPWDMRGNYEHWGSVAFGNPRILHFHTCGAYAPGEISWNLFDPTIVVDGVKIWRDGQFLADRLPNGPEILATYPCAARAFAEPDRNIGLAS